MKKVSIAFTVGAVAVVVLAAYALKPERGETPSVDILAPSQSPAPAAAAEVQAGLVGEWRSADDSKYTVHFYEDGTVTEQYAGEDDGIPLVDDTGRWLILVEDDVVTLVSTFGEDATYVYAIIVFDGERLTLREKSAIRDNHFVKVK